MEKERRRWKPEYDSRRTTEALKVRLPGEAAARLRARAKAGGVSIARLIELLVATDGAPTQRLHGLGVLGMATAATNGLADELHALSGEVRKANGSVRSLFIDAPKNAFSAAESLDAAALELRSAARRVDSEIARLADSFVAALAGLAEAAREVRR